MKNAFSFPYWKEFDPKYFLFILYNWDKPEQKFKTAQRIADASGWYIILTYSFSIFMKILFENQFPRQKKIFCILYLHFLNDLTSKENLIIFRNIWSKKNQKAI